VGSWLGVTPCGGGDGEGPGPDRWATVAGSDPLPAGGVPQHGAGEGLRALMGGTMTQCRSAVKTG
jgi:hypothetical protein